MKYLLILILTISGIGFSDDVGQIVVIGLDSACYKLANQAVFSAIQNAEAKAQEQCSSYPILRKIDISIKQAGGCTPVVVRASYGCLR